MIGKGNFGLVYRGKWKGAEVAVKTLKKESQMSSQAFLEEAAIMKRMRHDKLVKLYAVCTKSIPIYIIQEYMSNGCLLEYLHEKSAAINFEDLIYIAQQIASGMKYLDELGLIHRDLAARNVLVGENKLAKICGECRHILVWAESINET